MTDVNPLAGKVDADVFTTTWTGVHFPYASFTLDHISIDDIAHHLARQNRWLGAMNCECYSVAEHCVLLARHALEGIEDDLFAWVLHNSPGHSRDIKSLRQCLAFTLLLHDSDEYITGDFPSPLKALIPELKPYGNYVRSCVFQKYGASEILYPLSKPYDIRIRANEARFVRNTEGQYANVVPLPFDLQFWYPNEAAQHFLDLFKELS